MRPSSIGRPEFIGRALFSNIQKFCEGYLTDWGTEVVNLDMGPGLRIRHICPGAEIEPLCWCRVSIPHIRIPALEFPSG